MLRGEPRCLFHGKRAPRFIERNAIVPTDAIGVERVGFNHSKDGTTIAFEIVGQLWRRHPIERPCVIAGQKRTPHRLTAFGQGRALVEIKSNSSGCA